MTELAEIDLAPASAPGDAASTLDIIAAVDAAVDEHLDWLHQWNRALICREALSAGVADDGGCEACRFGQWYALHRHDGGLVDQPVFHDLAEAHRRMHGQARVLAGLARDGGAIPVGDYDRFVQAADDFNTRARRISAAFQRLLSDLDPLTGTHSRQTMMAELEREAVRARRTGAPLCLVLVDLDHFKRINDTHGHTAGDRVLATAAGRLLAQVRPYDTVFRYGGEEFLLCLPNADLEAAAAVCERLRMAIADPPVDLDDGKKHCLTASFGLALLRSGPVNDAIVSADRALYDAKRSGRNQVKAYTVVEAALDR
ncbi:MAG: diguanylate cyclase [Rhodospirillales bacterium]|nr:diguanylate cyclase [Rhodospirillales bacterium]